MEDSYTQLMTKLGDLETARADAILNNKPYPHFWDAFQPEEPKLDETFDNELSRTKLYEDLQDTVSEEHRFHEFLPPKAKLAFLASLERDASLLYKGRVAAFSDAIPGYNYRGQQAQETVERIKGVADAASEKGGLA